MSTVEENTAVPPLEVPPKNNVATETPEPTKETKTSTAIKRLSTIYSKAKTSVNDTIAEVQKVLTEKKSAAPPAETTETPAVEKKDNDLVKSILIRIKSIHKPSSTKPDTDAEHDETTPPVPPPKDNTKPSTSHPVIDQLKRNTALISNYLIQKKKDFTATNKKSDDATAPQEEASTEVVQKEAPTPLVRRITKLVNDAIKKKDTKPTETTTAETAAAPEAAAPTTTTA